MTEVAHVTRDSDTAFKVKRSKVKVTRIRQTDRQTDRQTNKLPYSAIFTIQSTYRINISENEQHSMVTVVPAQQWPN